MGDAAPKRRGQCGSRPDIAARKGNMFVYHHGLRLTVADLAVDTRRRHARAFVSHAHSDHIARHDYVLCTAPTAALMEHRLGKRTVRIMQPGEPIPWAGVTLTALPAGHCLGAAMLHVQADGQSLLYTGDFKLSPSATAAEAQPTKADILIMESTFGTPDYRMPPQDEVLSRLRDLVRRILDGGAVPVIEAYSLGKGQEITRRLNDMGFPVVQHPHVWAVSRIYESFGVNLGRYRRWEGTVEPGEAVVVPPRTRLEMRGLRQVRVAVTGWAVDPAAKYRLGVDHALPLSDHADYDELLEMVERVAPRVVYCTHGSDEFVNRLQELGWDARPLGRSTQRRLF
ncbi:MAG: ligase-associated DNA damage response exonuclease [Thermogutta sp.]